MAEQVCLADVDAEEKSRRCADVYGRVHMSFGYLEKVPRTSFGGEVAVS